jgi:5-methyltetrahydrofolate--homocysteine methyltransferase
MSTYPFLERLQNGEVLVADGATGTNLQARGLPTGAPSDLWVLENPEAVLQLHRDFIAAGSDILLTDTFGSTSIRLAHSNLADKAAEMNRTAVSLARQAIGKLPVLVAGSIGPTGELLKPLGTLEPEAARQAFLDQARALLDSGVDLLVVETQFDFSEARAALSAVRTLSPDIPLVCSFSFDRGTRTMMGVKPSQLVGELDSYHIHAVGINCGRSLEDNLASLLELKSSTQLPIWFKPNAGLPHTDSDGKSVYDVDPKAMGAAAKQWMSAGANIVGGCCGTSPEHLREIALAVRSG